MTQYETKTVKIGINVITKQPNRGKITEVVEEHIREGWDLVSEKTDGWTILDAGTTLIFRRQKN